MDNYLQREEKTQSRYDINNKGQSLVPKNIKMPEF